MPLPGAAGGTGYLVTANVGWTGQSPFQGSSPATVSITCTLVLGTGLGAQTDTEAATIASGGLSVGASIPLTVSGQLASASTAEVDCDFTDNGGSGVADENSLRINAIQVGTINRDDDS